MHLEKTLEHSGVIHAKLPNRGFLRHIEMSAEIARRATGRNLVYRRT
jgi:hypothetical protein